MPFVIKFDKEKCIGCGTCMAVCSDNWEIGQDGKANPKNSEINELGCNKIAEENCPVEAISIRPLSSKK